MSDTQKHTKPNVPNLRFPGFRGEWKQYTMGEITELFSRRNKNRTDYPMFSVTNARGFVNQQEQFEDREMKGEDISAYKIISPGEFAYNPARINVGSIARYDGETDCMISSLYVCFKVKTELVDSQLLLHILKSPKMVYNYGINGEGGVRIYLFYPNFSRIRVKLPSLEEQRKIASFLNLIEERIQIQNKVIERYKSLIRAITHTFFNSKSDYPRVPLSDLSPNIASGKSKLALGPFPLYGSTGIIGTCTSGIYKGEMILVARVGSIGQIQLINTGGCGITDNTLIVNSGELNHYVYFYLKSFDFQKITSGTTQPLITGSSLKAINVPVLPFQERDSFIKMLAAIEQRITLEQTILQQYLKTESFFLTSLFV